MTQPLFANQRQTIEFAYGKEALFDASDPGTGKTRSAIEIFRPRVKVGNDDAVLILAPKSLLRTAWQNDIRKFGPELLCSVATAETREKAFGAAAEVYITNHDQVNWLVQQPKSFWKRFKNGTLVVDESGGFKHHTAKRSKAAARIAPFFAHRECMNGTVNPNTILDVWHQYYLLDEGKRLGKSYYKFRNAVCVPEQVGREANMIRWVDRPGVEDAVALLVADITVRHKLEDCQDIPPNHQYCVPYTLPAKHLAQYKTMQAIEMLPLEAGTVTAIHAAALSTKLLQIASGAVYEAEGIYHVLDHGRYELIMDLLEPRAHSLVFFNWAHQREELVKAAQAHKMSYAVIDGTVSLNDREDIVRNFQAGYYKVLFAHPQSAAHGLTLVKARTTIWASPTYNLEHFMQGNRRIYRAGQTERTETIVVIAEGTIDEKVYAALSEKRVRMESLLEELRAAA
jgi:hypothetical protein